MKHNTIIFLSSVLVVLWSCNTKNLIETKFAGEAQGTYYAVTYFSEDSTNLQPQIDSILKTIDLSVSLWTDSSILSRINRNDSTVSPDAYFLELFQESIAVSEKTNGAFDITVGPLVNAWGFGFSDRLKLDKSKIDSLLPLIGFRNIKLVNNRIIKTDPHIEIDFNAIAQGYTVDIIGQFLVNRGIESFLIDVGGELLAKGTKPDKKEWVVGIEQPSESVDAERTLKATLSITNKAIATSGNYRKFFEENGIRYSHTIDPKTGFPVTHSLLSVTVVANKCSTADAYATAFMVMGLEKAKEFIGKNPGYEAYFIYSGNNGETLTYSTQGIKKFIKEE